MLEIYFTGYVLFFSYFVWHGLTAFEIEDWIGVVAEVIFWAIVSIAWFLFVGSFIFALLVLQVVRFQEGV